MSHMSPDNLPAWDTITIYGLRTERIINAIKALRAVHNAVEAAPLGLRDAKTVCDSLRDERSGGRVIVRVPSHMTDLVRTALSQADFDLYGPSTSTLLRIG